MNKKTHIISFDIPYPPNYGGIIDVYYKIKALHKAGVQVILHCFEYGREHAPELEKVCFKVFYYPRKKNILQQISLLPFIVKSRNHPDLLTNLLADICPIIFEGLHCCFLLDHPLLAAYTKIVRTHNIEHHYYFNLWNSDTELYKRYYFLIESFKLKLFENKLRHASHILGISFSETAYFSGKFENTILVPAFHPFSKITSLKGKGKYILFHGNLSVPENLKAVKYLIDEIFSELTVPVIIAGKNPPEWLISAANVIPHITLIGNPSIPEMDALIRDAQICLIPTFQSTGLKLKLLASLFGGRHCITNSFMLEGTGLEELCPSADTPMQMIQLINEYMSVKFTESDIAKRKQQLDNLFSNEKNAQKIIDIL